jgi:hypothetical protein
MRPCAPWILASLTAAAAAACGLDQNGLDVSGDGGIPPADGAFGDAPNGGADGSGDGASGDGAGDGAVTDAHGIDATPGADASADSAVDGGGVDASPDSARDASADSGPDPGIRCGGAFCSTPAEYCCLAAGIYTCLVGGIVCAGISINCDDAADCQGNQVCCAHESSSQLTGVDCTGTGGCQQNDVVLCDPGAPNVCASSMTCRPTTTGLQGYSECR